MYQRVAAAARTVETVEGISVEAMQRAGKITTCSRCARELNGGGVGMPVWVIAVEKPKNKEEQYTKAVYHEYFQYSANRRKSKNRSETEQIDDPRKFAWHKLTNMAYVRAAQGWHLPSPTTVRVTE